MSREERLEKAASIFAVGVFRYLAKEGRIREVEGGDYELPPRTVEPCG